MIIEEMIEILQAYKKGMTIQQKWEDGMWHDIPPKALQPFRWNWHDFEYRIKPAERKAREWTLVLDGTGDVVEVPHGTRMAELQRVRVREVLSE